MLVAEVSVEADLYLGHLLLLDSSPLLSEEVAVVVAAAEEVALDLVEVRTEAENLKIFVMEADANYSEALKLQVLAV